MGLTSPLPTYNELAKALKKASVEFDASQIHGLLCGLICANSEKTNAHWEPLLFPNDKHPTAYELLVNLYETSYHQLSEFSFEFTLLLPSDTVDINTRTETLGLWCQGFLSGIEQGKISHSSNDVTEALNDLLEISQVNYGDLTDDEEDETAYFELLEYVRLAVLMIFHEQNAEASPNDDAGERNLLH